MSGVYGGRPDYPAAERVDVVDDLAGGHRVADPYRWLEDPGDPRTVDWSAGQQALFEAERSRWPGKDRWSETLAALTAVDRVLPPKPRGDRVFLRKHAAGQDHPVLYVLEQGVERPLVDPQKLDPTGDTVLDFWEPSLEGDLIAVQFSRGGTEDSELSILDVATGAVVDGPIGRVRRSPIAWLPGGEEFFYVRRLAPELHPGEERYHRRVWWHRVGSPPDEDVLIFGDGRPKTQFYSVAVTADGRWLSITATAGTAPGTDLYLADLAEESPVPARHRPRLRPVQVSDRVRTRAHVVSGTKPGDPIWLRTDLDAPRGRVVACPAGGEADPSTWREVVAERPDAVLADFVVFAAPGLAHPIGLAVWTRHAVAELTRHDLAEGRELGPVPLPGIGAIGGVSAPPGGTEAWFMYADHGTPPRLLHFDARTGAVRPWPAVVGGEPGLRRPDVVTTFTSYRSYDGTTVRMFVVSPTGSPDRPRPTILTGYGGFGVSMTPTYSPEILAWVRAGGVHATACLRGGGEEGEEWHRAGRGAGKTVVFDDFEAAADHLVEAGWTTPEQLGVLGGSNGGLLVGAALTRHPEKYGAAVCLAPLLDMVRYERSGLGPSWVSEYGSAGDPEQLPVLISYSPYHHVESGTAYPPTLFAVADGDTRVDPAHARKMCAALQHASSGAGPILLRTERGVGHSSRAASRLVASQADCLAFFADHLGLTSPGGDV